MKSCWAASLGASMVLTFWRVSLVLAPVTPSKTSETRTSNWPLFSRATLVLSKGGAWKGSALGLKNGFDGPKPAAAASAGLMEPSAMVPAAITVLINNSITFVLRTRMNFIMAIALLICLIVTGEQALREPGGKWRGSLRKYDCWRNIPIAINDQRSNTHEVPQSGQ